MVPQDPFILLSWVNAQLRDHYSSLAALCEDCEIPMDDLTGKLSQAGFTYDPATNQFH